MKKVLFVIESLETGGAEKSLINLLNSIDTSKFNITLLLLTKNDKSFKNLLPSKINIQYISTKKINLTSRLRYKLLKLLYPNTHSAQLYWKSFRNIYINHKNNYDIAISYNQGFSTYFVAEKINATKKYAWLNTDYIKAGYKAKLDINYYNKYNTIICVSQHAKKSFTDAFLNLKLTTNIDIIKDISNTNIIKNKANEQVSIFNSNYINIVSVGRLVKPKAFNLAIESCKQLISKGYNIKWYIIGEGSERLKLEKLIVLNKLENNFYLLGYKENPYPYIKNCSIYVQTSIFEGLGLTIIEATILNKPIVTTNFPTAHEIITHNKTGLICDMNSNSITNSIITYIEIPDLIKSIVKNLESIENNDTEKSLNKINNLLS